MRIARGRAPDLRASTSAGTGRKPCAADHGGILRRGLRRRELRLPLIELRHRLATRRIPEALNRGPEGDPEASVAVILAHDPDAVLLIRRAEREGDPWSGHIGLPGGRADPDDTDLLGTAIRETVEEVGIELREEQYLGRLDTVVPRSPFSRLVVVHPHVFLLPGRPLLSLSHEVAEAFWVSLDQLRDPAIQREMTIDLMGRHASFPAYYLPQGIVWGLTERILTPLLALM